MTICERLFDELDKRNLTAYALCKALGVTTSTTTTWKQRGTDPPAKYLCRICEFLECSLEYLLTGSDAAHEIKKRPDPEMSRNGREMLALYEQLPEREQLLILGHLQQMVTPLQGNDKAKSNSPVLGTSAGKVG